MALLLAGRVATIPFAATLNAANQFKVRKAIELAAYILAAIAIGFIAWRGLNIHWALLSLNVTFLLGALLTVGAAARYIPLSKALAPSTTARAIGVFRAALPFMANNLTGLLTYGGFIWFASLAVAEDDVAKLAVLHGFVLVNLYQLYDVFLKSRQADLVDARRVARYRQVNWLVMFALPPAFMLTGREALGLIGNPVPIGLFEVVLFGIFMAFEMGNLFAQSVTQVNMALVHRLNTYSALRACLLIPFAAAWLTVDQNALVVLLSLLTLGSMTSFWYLMRKNQLPTIGTDRRVHGGLR